MNKQFFISFILISCLSSCFKGDSMCDNKCLSFYKVEKVQEIGNFFPKTVEQVTDFTEKIIKETSENLDKILAIPQSKRNFKNTIKALDILTTNFGVISSAISLMEMLNPDETMIASCHQATIDMQNFAIEKLSANKKLYQVFKDYVENISLSENLTDVEEYF